MAAGLAEVHGLSYPYMRSVKLPKSHGANPPTTPPNQTDNCYPCYCELKSNLGESSNVIHPHDSRSSASSPGHPVGGVIVGTLDLLYAMVVYSPHHPFVIPQHIATGVLGPSSYRGGIPTIILGVILHFFIAIGAAGVYYLASRRQPFLVDRPILCGMIFGGLVYFFMHLVVLPLSAAPHLHATPFIYQATEFIEHWFFVGLPISFSVRHYSR